MKSFSKEKRDRLVLVCIGAVVAVVGLYYGVIASQRNSLESLVDRRGEKQSKLANAERLIGNASTIQKNLEAATAKLKTIESTMASGDMYSWIILTVNSFKENYRVEIPQFSRE